MDASNEPLRPDEQPPLFSSWNHIYAFVLILHAFILVLFYLFTHAYS